MIKPSVPVFFDESDEPLDLQEALCILREHLGETIDLTDIDELPKK